MLAEGVVPLVCSINAVSHWQAFCFILDSRTVQGLLGGGWGGQGIFGREVSCVEGDIICTCCRVSWGH